MSSYPVHLGYYSDGEEIGGIAFMDNTTDKAVVVSVEKIFIHLKNYNNSVTMFEDIQEYLNGSFLYNFENRIANNIYGRTKMFPSMEVFSYNDVQFLLQKRRDYLFPLDVSSIGYVKEIYNTLSQVCDLTRCILLPDKDFDNDEIIPFYQRTGKNRYAVNESSFSAIRLFDSFFVLPSFITDCDIIKKYII